MAHPCDLCCEVLATEDDLFLHLATHADLNINLELENNHFSQETPVESLLASTEKLLYICEICKAECPTISDLKTHVLGHSNDKILFENPVKSEEPSPLELSSTSLALSHISVKTNNNQLQYQCEICDKTFSSWTHTKRHLLMHTGEKPHQCNVCGKGFAQKTDMLRHFKTHTGQRDYRCEICEKTFTLKSNLKSHLLTHSSDKAHQCNLCEKWFALKSYLSAHLRWHQKRQHKCDVCGEVFNQRKGLLSHQLLQHTRAQQYQCNVCSISFTEKNNLDIHSLIHEGERPHKCQKDKCKKFFAQKTALLKHQVKHNYKPYKCNLCTKAFCQFTSFKTHQLIHNGENPHQCEVCHKKFTQKSNLKVHYLLHTGEKPHKCGSCHMTFNQKSNLVRHELTHTGIKVLSVLDDQNNIIINI